MGRGRVAEAEGEGYPPATQSPGWGGAPAAAGAGLGQRKAGLSAWPRCVLSCKFLTSKFCSFCYVINVAIKDGILKKSNPSKLKYSREPGPTCPPPDPAAVVPAPAQAPTVKLPHHLSMSLSMTPEKMTQSARERGTGLWSLPRPTSFGGFFKTPHFPLFYFTNLPEHSRPLETHLEGMDVETTARAPPRGVLSATPLLSTLENWRNRGAHLMCSCGYSRTDSGAGNRKRGQCLTHASAG